MTVSSLLCATDTALFVVVDDTQNGVSPLMYAVREGHKDCVELLATANRINLNLTDQVRSL